MAAPLGLSRTTTALFPGTDLYPDPALFPGVGSGADVRKLGAAVIGVPATSSLAGTVAAHSAVSATAVGGALPPRQLGVLVVTTVAKPRPASQVRKRAVGATVIRGLLIVGPPSTVRVRRLGAPLLSGHIGTTGLVRTRRLGVVEVNVRFLAPPALSRV